ncbi:MAG: DUF4192 domain-containing protein, partial [Actinomycetes bacterium]
MSRRKRSRFGRRGGGPRIRPTLRSARETPERRLRLSGPDDLVAAVPYLLGFHPRESLVTVFVAEGCIQLTGRLDLPPAEGLDAVVGYLGALMRRQRPESVVLLTYSDGGEPVRSFAEEVTRRLQPQGVTESLLVSGGRWWSLTCSDAACCPAEGTPYDP